MPVSKNRRKGRQKAKTKAKPKNSIDELSKTIFDAVMFEFPDASEEDEANGGSDDLSRAQDLVFDAWEAPTKRARVAIARNALELSEDCADAWTLLAEEGAKGLVDRLRYYENAVEAGKRAIGERAFVEDVGYFWGLLETRPYMRARVGLADSLWNLGQRQEAVEHLKDMLRLNPHDNQGIRSILAAYLLFLHRLDEAEALLKDYEDEDFAQWCFDRALLLYMKNGKSSKEALSALHKALTVNPYVADYLLENRRIPNAQPEGYMLGTREEAILYTVYSSAAWRNAEGSLIWLSENLDPKLDL